MTATSYKRELVDLSHYRAINKEIGQQLQVSYYCYQELLD